MASGLMALKHIFATILGWFPLGHVESTNTSHTLLLLPIISLPFYRKPVLDPMTCGVLPVWSLHTLCLICPPWASRLGV